MGSRVSFSSIILHLHEITDRQKKKKKSTSLHPPFHSCIAKTYDTFFHSLLFDYKVSFFSCSFSPFAGDIKKKPMALVLVGWLVFVIK